MSDYSKGFNDGLIVGISQKGFVERNGGSKEIIFGTIELCDEITNLQYCGIIDGIEDFGIITEVI